MKTFPTATSDIVKPHDASSLTEDTLKTIKSIPHAHIAQRIELIWGTTECDKYINDLLIADRERAGFTPDTSKLLFFVLSLNEMALRETQKMKSKAEQSGQDWAKAGAGDGKWKIVKSPESKIKP